MKRNERQLNWEQNERMRKGIGPQFKADYLTASKKCLESVGQYDLYDGTPPHSNQTTSLEAARAATITLRAAVYEAIALSSDGKTDLELEEELGMGGSTIRPRRRELFLLNKIKDSGRVRLTKSGRKAIVWILNRDAQGRLL